VPREGHRIAATSPATDGVWRCNARMTPFLSPRAPLSTRVFGAPGRDQPWAVAAVVVGLSVLFYVSNPYWYGDAIWYATEIGRDRPLPLDAGHLIWRPVGALLWRALRDVEDAVDPLVALRLLSSVATASLCVLTYRAGGRLGFGRHEALAAAAIVAGSKVCLAYGGSGSSYPAAMALGVLALMPMLPRETRAGWQLRDGAASVAAFTAAWATWGVAALLLPAVFVAALVYGTGTLAHRVRRAAALCVAAGGSVLAVALGVYLFWVHTETGPAFSPWLGAAGHEIPLLGSVLGVARAAVGFVNSLVHLGTLPRSMKGILLADWSIVDRRDTALGAALLLLAGTGLVLAGRRMAKRLQHPRQNTIRIVAMTCGALLPLTAFAVLWQGSDVERYSLAVPLVALAAVHCVRESERQTKRRGLRAIPAAWLLAGVICLANASTFVVPRLITRGGVLMALGREARDHLGAGALVVFTGQDLWAPVESATEYFWGLDAYDIHYDVSVRDASGWDARLRDVVASALQRSGRIALLSDLLGRPTPGGIGLSTREYPVPSLDDVARQFAGWTVGEGWRVGRFTFLEVTPPGTRAP